MKDFTDDEKQNYLDTGIFFSTPEVEDSTAHYLRTGTRFWMDSKTCFVVMVLVAHIRNRGDGYYVLHYAYWSYSSQSRYPILGSFCERVEGFDSFKTLASIAGSLQ